MTEAAAPRQRVDQWLWFARFFKTRGLATKLVQAGHLRVDGDRVGKPAFGVQTGQTLTFPQGRRIRVIRVISLAERRGPAVEAQTLYEDLTPPEDPVPQNPRYEGRGRPSKKDRRDAALSRRQISEGGLE